MKQAGNSPCRVASPMSHEKRKFALIDFEPQRASHSELEGGRQQLRRPADDHACQSGVRAPQSALASIGPRSEMPACPRRHTPWLLLLAAAEHKPATFPTLSHSPPPLTLWPHRAGPECRCGCSRPACAPWGRRSSSLCSRRAGRHPGCEANLWCCQGAAQACPHWQAASAGSHPLLRCTRSKRRIPCPAKGTQADPPRK